MGSRLESTHQEKCGNLSLEANQDALKLRKKLPSYGTSITIKKEILLISFHSQDGKNHT